MLRGRNQPPITCHNKQTEPKKLDHFPFWTKQIDNPPVNKSCIWQASTEHSSVLTDSVDNGLFFVHIHYPNVERVFTHYILLLKDKS